MRFTRISTDPKWMGGVPCIRGLRIPVATVVGMMADGLNREQILTAMPDLVAEDIHEALHYAAETVREGELPLLISSAEDPAVVEESWSAEIGRRVRQIDAGEVRGVPESDVRHRLGE